MIYTSTPTGQMDQLVTRFNDSYPDIQVEYFRSGTTEVMNRLEADSPPAPTPRRMMLTLLFLDQADHHGLCL